MIRLAVAFCLSLLVTVPVALAQVQGPEPDAIVRDIYAAYGPESWPDDAQGQHFSPDLLALYTEVVEGAGDNVELGIDFDVFRNAQDVDAVTDLSTRIDQASPDMQVVDATFTAFGQEQIVRYTFIATADGWKIDDIDWGEEGANLRALLGQLLAEQRGGFEDEGEAQAEE
jgi:hypothetical protein